MFYDKRNAGILSSLCVKAQQEGENLLAAWEKEGIWVLLTQGYRSWAAQAWDYASGRYRPGPIITNAKPGWSFHQFKVAFDFVPADGNGGIHYEDNNRYQQAITIAKTLGWESGQDFPSPDKPHLQFTGGHDITYFRNGGTL